MEKTMSVEDKIRRAEDIYYRRKEGLKRESINSKPKKDIKLLKKMIKQIIICLIIYSVFYTIVNNDYIFSKDFTNKAKEILSQDINFNELYKMFLNKFQNTTIIKEDIENSEVIQNEETLQEDSTDIQNNNENIGGAEESTTTTEVKLENSEVKEIELSQMEQDANYIKSTINFIKPVEGTISSMYGLRNPTTATVPKNHTGTDIAAAKGTKIVSATNGTVILASSKGDYGKHLKIQINDVIVIYAHCNKLYVKEGDTISQGQEIAEVGATGNTTGPHLHFEVRYQDRTVNPQMILEL